MDYSFYFDFFLQIELAAGATITILENAKKVTATAKKDVKQIQVPADKGFYTWEIFQMIDAQDLERERVAEEEKKRKEEVVRVAGQKRVEREEKKKVDIEAFKEKVEQRIMSSCSLCKKEKKGPTNGWKKCSKCEYWMCGRCSKVEVTMLVSHQKLSHPTQSESSSSNPNIVQYVDENFAAQELLKKE